MWFGGAACFLMTGLGGVVQPGLNDGGIRMEPSLPRKAAKLMCYCHRKTESKKDALAAVTPVGK